MAILGLGTVGAEVSRALGRDAEHLEKIFGRRIEVVCALVREADRPRDVPIPPERITTDPEAVFASRPDLIIEVLGGCDPACAIVCRALRAGVHVVTANKSLVAAHGPAIERAAALGRAFFRYEACAGAAIPVVRTLQSRRGDQLLSLLGVVNGSCTFILRRMEIHRCTWAQAVEEARRQGLVEPDPVRDPSGLDAAEKLAILARCAGVSVPAPEELITSPLNSAPGIMGLTEEDLRAAAQDGCVLRLIASLEVNDHGGAHAFVGPALLPRTHVLASLEGAGNGILLRHAHAGQLFLSGPGAGPEPTAAAIVADLISCLHEGAAGGHTLALAARSTLRPREGGEGRRSQRGLLRLTATHGATADPERLLEIVSADAVRLRHAEFRGPLAFVSLDLDVGDAVRLSKLRVACARAGYGDILFAPLIGC